MEWTDIPMAILPVWLLFAAPGLIICAFNLVDVFCQFIDRVVHHRNLSASELAEFHFDMKAIMHDLLEAITLGAYH